MYGGQNELAAVGNPDEDSQCSQNWEALGFVALIDDHQTYESDHKSQADIPRVTDVHLKIPKPLTGRSKKASDSG